MNLIDMRTVILSYIISNGICAVVIGSLWFQSRRRFAGLGLWLADFVMQFAALLLVALRGMVPDLASATVSNASIIGGTILLYMGLEQFVGKPSKQIHNAILLAVFILAHAYFLLISPSLDVRTIILSLGLLLICSQCAWLLLHRVDAEMRPITRIPGIIFLAYCLVSVIRIFVDLIVPLGNDFFQSNLFDTLLVMAYQMLFVILALGLFLMVNRRLLADLEHDISERKRVEEELRLSEEKFFKAFHSSPDAVLLTRLSDGKLVEVNEGFSRLTGYSREEALASTTLNLYLWANPQDRESCISALRENQSIRNHEYNFRTKSGKIFSGLYSGELIYLGDETHVISAVRDITESKQVEQIIQLRLRLYEFSVSHSLGELMQKALDEIGLITNSPIGFYHFVEPDQKTLSLQAWSTRTLEEFCHAEGKGMHYDIDQAGVWVDCVYQRKPVIHNDYAALPHRKGMPEGHAEVIRELVVPIMRDGRVVSILGMGNKPSDYDDKDIELVSYIADVVWVIVERKRAEEEIQLLQAELREQVIRDPLTGLYNRRYLNETLRRELARAERENYPISLVMIDIDHFKEVNDAFGHGVGDSVLQRFASQLMNQTRAGDFVCRYGGEEFLVVLPNVTIEIAFQIAERWRRSFQEGLLSQDGREIKSTISGGISEFPVDGITSEELIAIADKALYNAKALGRNQVVARLNRLT